MSAELQGSDAPEASQGTVPPQGPESPKNITNEDMNRAITARFKDFEKRISSQFDQTFNGLASKLEETLAGKLAGMLKPAPEEVDAPGTQPPAPGAPPDKGKEPNADLSAFKRQLSELRNELKSSKEEAQRERASARDAKLRQTVVDALSVHGITGSRAKHALGHLVDVAKLVSMNETGAIVMADEFGEPVDLETGLKAWASTEDAKIYVPPRGTAGSGGSNPNNKGAAPAPATPFSRAAQLLAEKLQRG